MFANSSLTFRVLRRIQLLQLECSCLPILRVTSSDGHEHVDGEPNEVDVACGFNTEHDVVVITCTSLGALSVMRSLSKMYVYV